MPSSSPNNNKREAQEYHVTYTARDVLLYATAIGFGADASRYQADLPFVWEAAPTFRVAPTWAATLPFWAQTQHSPSFTTTTTTTTAVLPPFPPPSMKQIGVLPRGCLSKASVYESLATDYPILHTRQTITWHQPLAVPRPTASYRLLSQWVAVQPKSIGTFGTTQVDLFEPSTLSSTPVCTMQSTTLILGLDSDQVNPWKNVHTYLLESPHVAPREWYKHSPPTYTERVVIRSNEALVYRLASGDTNGIHVDPNGVVALGGDDDENDSAACILHGLATLGIVSRIIIQQQHNDLEWKHLDAHFTHPVYMGDTIEVQLWYQGNGQSSQWLGQHEQVIYFRVVVVKASGRVAVDRGAAVLHRGKAAQSKL